jgi:hypothetical protein
MTLNAVTGKRERLCYRAAVWLEVLVPWMTARAPTERYAASILTAPLLATCPPTRAGSIAR